MPSRTKIENPEILRKQLLELLQEFEPLINREDLRSKVKALIPINHSLRNLGASIQKKPIPTGSRKRILQYLLQHIGLVISGDELMVVAGISEYARRVRELRTQSGWSILSGATVRKIMDLGEDSEGLPAMKNDDYILVSGEADEEAARRWKVANSIRRKTIGASSKILEYLRKNVGQAVSGEELQYIAQKYNWPRRVRELRTEQGWPIATKVSGRPDLPIGTYVLEDDKQSPPHDRNIKEPVRREVLLRDKHECQNCGWNHDLWNSSDPRHLEVHHIIHHKERGPNIAKNLITLCNICHNVRHADEKSSKT